MNEQEKSKQLKEYREIIGNWLTEGTVGDTANEVVNMYERLKSNEERYVLIVSLIHTCCSRATQNITTEIKRKASDVLKQLYDAGED